MPAPGNTIARPSVAGVLLLVLLGGPGLADEGGVSFWLPGQYASFAALAPTPGFSLPMQTYYYSGSAGGSTPLARGGTLDLGVDTDFAAEFLVPTWAPDTTFLGGRPAFSIAGFPGWNQTSANLTAAGHGASRTDSVTGFGDLYPTAQIFWNRGVNNWMAYVTGDVPVGDYDPHRLANLGIGHGAIDAGGAYTYLDTATGWEFSATAGVTYNFVNPDTDYTSGIDSHLDLGLSKSLSDRFFVGLVGYAYVQLTPDDGQPAALGDFESQVFGIGPQIGYTFDVGSVPIYTNLRAYFEFGAKNRTQGGGGFLTINIPLSGARS